MATFAKIHWELAMFGAATENVLQMGPKIRTMLWPQNREGNVVGRAGRGCSWSDLVPILFVIFD